MALFQLSPTRVRWWVIGVAALLIAAGGTFGYLRWRSASPTTGGTSFDKVVIPKDDSQKQFTLTPTKSDRLGVDPATAFTLKATTAIAKKDIEASLAFTPSVSFAVAEAGENEFTITPAAPLTAAAVYKIALGATVQGDAGPEKQTFSWAVQAKQALAVDGTLPRDKATGVPLDTGIEVTFTTDKLVKPGDAIAVQPATAGRFEQHGRVVVFVPQEKLQPATLYTVTVRQGLQATDSDVTLAADTTFRFETTSADSANGSSFYGSFNSAFHAVRPKEAPVIDAGYVDGDFSAAKISVYAFADTQELISRLQPLDVLPQWAYAARERTVVDVTGLRKVGEYKPTVEKYESQTLVHLPSGFDAGYYLIDMVLNGKRLQSVVAVSDIGVALYATEQEAVLWVKDLSTKQSLTGATVTSVDGKVTATVDADGVAHIKTPENFNALDATGTNRSYYTITAKDGRTLVVPLTQSTFFGMGEMWRWRSADPDYWSYLSTDRTLYRPDDTLNVWGVARVRSSQDIAPLDLTLEVWSWNVVDGSGAYLPLQAETVTTDAYGAYQASLTLKQLKPGSYTLGLKDAAGTTIRSQSFDVRTFTKPAYQILVTPDKLAGFNGEKVTYSVQTQFFDGTPAPNIALAYAAYGQAGEAGTGITTNALGRASVTETIHAADASRTEYMHRSFFPTAAAEGDIVTDADIVGFPSGVTYEPEGSFTGTAATASFTVHAVDLAKVTPTNYWEAQLTGAVMPNAPVTGTVYEQVVHKTKSGQHYDFIEKKVVDSYTYNVTEEKREQFTGVTDANGKFSKAFTLTGETYTVKFSVRDVQGRPATRTLWLYRDGYRWSSDSTGYSMSTSEQAGAESNLSPTLPVGASADIRFTKGSQSVAGKGPFLFLKLQNGIQEVTVRDASSFRYTLVSGDAPNIAFTAAYFDGTAFRLAQGEASLTLDVQDRALSIAVTPEQKSYGPGDTVQADVRVTDAAGKPVQAMVNLSAIDAAIAAIQIENAPTPLQTLYTFVPSGLMQQYASHEALRLDAMAEGGGGGDQPRKLFKDAVLFQSVETNRDGHASVTFTVPDNLTSWQVIAQGVTKDLKAGSTTVSIPVTKSIFGTLTMAEEFVAADSPKVVANAYGSGLNGADDVQFTVETSGIGKVQVRTGKAFQAQLFTLPKLAVGPQEIRLTVQRGNDKDILVRIVQVLSSRVTKAESVYLDASVGQTVAPAGPGRTSLTFSDAGRGRVVQVLQALQWSYGKRVERHLGSRIAVDLLQSMQVEAAATSSFEPTAYQQDDGGISQVTYGSSDLTTSAYVAARADLFDAAALARYFTAKLEQKSASLGQQGLALLGLANLGKPVLADLESFLQQPDIDAQDQLTAALAYLALGSNDKAIAIAAALWQKYGTVETPFAKLSLGAGDRVITNTARFSILAEGLKLPQRQGIARFLEANFPQDAVTNLERSLAMRVAVPLLDNQAVSITYDVSGKVATAALQNGATKTVSLTSDELKSFRVTAVQGPVGIVTSTFAPVDVRTAKVDKRLGIERSFTNMKAGKTSFEQGDLVRVDITPKVSKDITDRQFFIVDELPSGFILVTNPWNHGLPDTYVDYPIEVDHQRVTFWSDGSRAIHYYARVFIPGGYAAEPVLIQGQSSRDLVNYSGAQTLELK